MSNLSGREVIQFFKSADLELAELALEFGSQAVEDRRAVRAKQSANLKKARAARKPKGSKGGQSQVAVADTAAAAPATPRSPRHERVAAPPHTASSTSVESDTLTI